MTFNRYAKCLLAVWLGASAAAGAADTRPASTQASMPGPQQSEASQPSRRTIHVSDVRQLREALAGIRAGTTLLIAPGSYAGGLGIKDVLGWPDAPIIISGSDPNDPPVFTGGTDGIKLSRCGYVKLSSMVFKDARDNGVHVDDGGDRDLPSHHILIEDVTVLNTGPQGNHDALKISGLMDFVVRRCRFEGWGGSGFDAVGCHLGVIEGCRFLGRPGFRQKNAIQIKGGSSSILVQTCFFHNVGERAVCIGGSTGLEFFRPAVTDYEARNITVAGCRFVGGEAHVAWITSQGGYVHHNIFCMPEKWVLRILQESEDRRFKPCGGGVFEDNLVVTDGRPSAFVGVGPRTAPASFQFRHNAWHSAGPANRPDLPAREAEGVYDVDPQLLDPGTERMRIGSAEARLEGIGPRAYVPWRQERDFAEVSIPPYRPKPDASGQAMPANLILYALLAVAVLVALVVKLRRRAERES